MTASIMVTGLIMAILLFAEHSNSAVLQNKHDLDYNEKNSVVHQDEPTDTNDENIPSHNVTATDLHVGEKSRRSKRSWDCPCCNGERRCDYTGQEWIGWDSCTKRCHFNNWPYSTDRDYYRGMPRRGCMNLQSAMNDAPWCFN